VSAPPLLDAEQIEVLRGLALGLKLFRKPGGWQFKGSTYLITLALIADLAARRLVRYSAKKRRADITHAGLEVIGNWTASAIAGNLRLLRDFTESQNGNETDGRADQTVTDF
jgi:hypothetical protein